MATKFEASHLKIDRARKHLAELEQVVSEWLETNPVQFTSRIERNGIFFNMKAEPVPATVSAIVGDIFHNLRSSLDLMAAELCGSPGQPNLEVSFPFSSEESGIDEAIKRGKFEGAGETAVKLLKELKPYRGGNVELRSIHDLNIRDKHKMLIARPMSFSTPIIDTRPPEGGLAIVGDPSKPSDVKLFFPPDCDLAQRELIPTIYELVAVIENVIRRFEKLGDITQR